MPEQRFELTGKTAAIAGIAVIALVGFRLATMGGGSDDPVLEREVRLHLQSNTLTGDVDSLRQAVHSEDQQAFDRAMGSIEAGGAELHAIQVSKPLLSFASGGSDAVVKVTYSPTSGEQAGTTQVTYMLFEHSPLAGTWHYRYETSSYKYWSNLF